jgi:hypothetical protein
MSWCEITIQRTPHATLRKGTLTLDVDSAFSEGFVRFLRALPWEDRGWDKATTHWWVHARHLEAVCQAALESYREVYLIDGSQTTNIRTGQVTHQGRLFDEG